MAKCHWRKKKAVLVDAIDLSGVAQNDAFTMTVPKVAGGDGVAHQFVFDNGTDVDALSDANGFGINIAGADDEPAVAAVVIKAINGVADNLYQYGGATLGAGSSLAAGTLGLVASAGSTATKVTLTMTNFGSAGNVENVLAANTGFENDLLLESFSSEALAHGQPLEVIFIPLLMSLARQCLITPILLLMAMKT